AVKVAVPSSTRQIEDQIKIWLKRSPKSHALEVEKQKKNMSSKIVGKRQFYRKLNKQKEQLLHMLNGGIDAQIVSTSSGCNTLLRFDISSITDIEGVLDSYEPFPHMSISDDEQDSLNEHVDVPNFCNSSACDQSLATNLDQTINENEKQMDIAINSVSLSTKLKQWAITSGVTHSTVTNLLHILSPYHAELPLDCRTLLKTPTKTNIIQLETGSYCHIGLQKGITHFLLTNSQFIGDELQIGFNIDGIPLYKSKNSQLWPILGQIKNSNSSPFPIGVFYGNAKPQPLQLFLKDLINELNILMIEGITVMGKSYRVQIFAFMCDSPARAFLKCIKYHSGYSSCEKCIEVGNYVDGRVVFLSTSAPKRTDHSFKNQTDEDHHTGISPLIEIQLGMVSQFPIDYMHNICLGVVKKLLTLWLNGPLQFRLQNRL
ncbi:hypothetical protein PPYR_00436, partial [Photinus pyralis]